VIGDLFLKLNVTGQWVHKVPNPLINTPSFFRYNSNVDSTLGNLLQRVSAAARSLPGATELYLFGSAADPALADAYSDLDLHVLTGDYPRSRAAWPWILSQAGPVELAFPLQETPHESSFCIAFSGESPYHKVDIGLSDRSQPGFFSQIQSKTLLWQQPMQPLPAGQPRTTRPEETYVPAPGSAAHFLLGEMLSSVRYVKARRRGQHLAGWRFLSAKANALIRGYEWDGNSASFPANALSTWEYTALDRRLPAALRLELLSLVDCRTPQAMDAALLALSRRIAALILPQCGPDDAPAAPLVQRYLAFIASELDSQPAKNS
jgi:hypothetical protein